MNTSRIQYNKNHCFVRIVFSAGARDILQGNKRFYYTDETVFHTHLKIVQQQSQSDEPVVWGIQRRRRSHTRVKKLYSACPVTIIV